MHNIGNTAAFTESSWSKDKFDAMLIRINRTLIVLRVSGHDSAFLTGGSASSGLIGNGNNVLCILFR